MRKFRYSNLSLFRSYPDETFANALLQKTFLPITDADLSTPIPNGTGSFTDFRPTDPCISLNKLAFIGSGSASQQGVYLVNTNPVPPPIMPITDTNTEVGDFGSSTRFSPIPPPIVPPNPYRSIHQRQLRRLLRRW